MDLVCVGDVMLDVHIASGALARGGDLHGRVAIRPGGTSANAAVWGAWAGASSAVIAAVGDDLAGTLCVEAVAGRGVDVGGVVRRTSPTGVMVVMIEDGDRSMVADRGANAQLEVADVQGIEAAAVLVSGYLFLQEPGHDVAVAAIGSAHTPLLADEREARVLTGAEGDDAARALGERYRFAAVKRAANGATLIAEGRLVAADGEAVEEVEATGAGDAFDGVLLSALALGREPEEAIARACHAGALVAASRATWPE